MEIDGIKALTFVLVFVPGYIFIHTLDYHLLKGEKSQFEKTIQAVISSVILWTLFILFPFQPLNDQKQYIINTFFSIIEDPNNKKTISILFQKINYSLILFGLLCVYSFIFAFLYGILRKTRIISKFIQLLTRRDYFKEVAFRFFSEGLDKTVIINMKNHNRYLGILIGTPDQKDDHKIIIHDSYIQEENKWSKLIADRLLIDLNDIELIEISMEDTTNGRNKERLCRRFFSFSKFRRKNKS